MAKYLKIAGPLVAIAVAIAGVYNIDLPKLAADVGLCSAPAPAAADAGAP